MRWIFAMIRTSHAPVLLALALICAGCATPPPEPVANEPVVEDPVVIPAPEPEPEPEVLIPPPAALPKVAILLTSQQAAYADVARELSAHFEEFTLFDLSDGSAPPVSILRSVNDSPSEAVIAIGLRAAQSSIAMARVPVVFSQVFNYNQHSLVTGNSRGVAPWAPLDKQLASWAEIDTDLRRVGMIIGEGHDDLVAEARKAALAHHVELVTKVAHSDQETIYLFRRMVREVDGFWMMPDSRILSRRALTEIVAEAKRRGVSVAVPNEALMTLGADVSLSSVASDIAATIVDIVRQIQSDGVSSVPAMTPLSDIRVVSRPEKSSDITVAESGEQP